MAKATPMNPEYKAKWVKKLRSGKYNQGTGNLYYSETDNYCCLGVLRTCFPTKALKHGQLPQNEMLNADQLAEAGLNTLKQRFLISCNDNYEWDFKKIADYIEKKY